MDVDGPPFVPQNRGMNPLEANAPLPFLISRAAHMSRRLLTKTLSEEGFDLTPEEAMVILLISKFEARSVSSLAQKLGRDRTTVSRFLESLERKGMVERVVDTEDRRSTLTQLTEQGRAFEQVMETRGKQDMLQLLVGISPTDLIVVVRTLVTLTERAAEILGDPGHPEPRQFA
jgi:DNA-binding MarR family transcriptional regulator